MGIPWPLLRSQARSLGVQVINAWIVCPAYKRFMLSDACFEEWKWLRGAMEAYGVALHVVVVADDANVALAQKRGFDTVIMDNTYLGRKFNAGFEYAAKRGADYIIPRGSDDWIHPNYLIEVFENPPVYPQIATSEWICFVDERGWRGKQCRIAFDGRGCGPYVIPTRFFDLCPRPTEDTLNRGIDNSYLKGLQNVGQPGIDWQFRNADEGAWCQFVDFKSPNVQIWSYDSIPFNVTVLEMSNILESLREFYPDFLINKIRAYYRRPA